MSFKSYIRYVCACYKAYLSLHSWFCIYMYIIWIGITCWARKSFKVHELWSFVYLFNFVHSVRRRNRNLQWRRSSRHSYPLRLLWHIRRHLSQFKENSIFDKNSWVNVTLPLSGMYHTCYKWKLITYVHKYYLFY